MKIIDSYKISKNFAENEIECLKNLNHEHIIKLEDYFIDNQFYYIVTEYIEG